MATYLHYLLLARPEFLVAQGLLITMRSVMFLVGIGGVGIRQLKVNWEDKDLHKFIYASIYRLYDPSHFADPSYTRTGFNKETSEAFYTVDFSTKMSRTVTPEPRKHVTVGRSHDQTGSDPSRDPPHDQSRDQAPKPASNQSCDKEREHDLMHAYFCRRNLCYVHDRY